MADQAAGQWTTAGCARRCVVAADQAASRALRNRSLSTVSRTSSPRIPGRVPARSTPPPGVVMSEQTGQAEEPPGRPARAPVRRRGHHGRPGAELVLYSAWPLAVQTVVFASRRVRRCSRSPYVDAVQAADRAAARAAGRARGRATAAVRPARRARLRGRRAGRVPTGANVVGVVATDSPWSPRSSTRPSGSASVARSICCSDAVSSTPPPDAL